MWWGGLGGEGCEIVPFYEGWCVHNVGPTDWEEESPLYFGVGVRGQGIFFFLLLLSSSLVWIS